MEQLWLEASTSISANSNKSAPLRKVPGEVAPMGKLNHEVKAFRDSIQKKTLPELDDLLTRQRSIISNKKLLSKLPDKGAKVQEKIKHIEVSIIHIQFSFCSLRIFYRPGTSN